MEDEFNSLMDELNAEVTNFENNCNQSPESLQLHIDDKKESIALLARDVETEIVRHRDQTNLLHLKLLRNQRLLNEWETCVRKKIQAEDMLSAVLDTYRSFEANGHQSTKNCSTLEQDAGACLYRILDECMKGYQIDNRNLEAKQSRTKQAQILIDLERSKLLLQTSAGQSLSKSLAQSYGTNGEGSSVNMLMGGKKYVEVDYNASTNRFNLASGNSNQNAHRIVAQFNFHRDIVKTKRDLKLLERAK